MALLKCDDFELIPISARSPEYFADLYISWIEDPSVTRYLYQGTFLTTKEDVINTYKSMVNNNNFVYYIWPTESGLRINKPVGIEGIHDIHWPSKNGECRTLIGDKSYWNKGYAKKCLALMTELAFQDLNFHKFWYGFNGNHPKIRAAYKNNGFKEECIVKDHFYKNGEYSNLVRMCMFKDDYKSWMATDGLEKILNG